MKKKAMAMLLTTAMAVSALGDVVHRLRIQAARQLAAQKVETQMAVKLQKEKAETFPTSIQVKK